MVRTSISLLTVAILALLFSDISITTLDPWQELSRMCAGLATPRLPEPQVFLEALLNTISFALIGITLAVVFGSCLALFFHITAVRLFCSFIRAIHELFWAFLLMPLIGLNAVCGILAIAIPFTGVFAKVYAEIAQESNTDPRSSLPKGASQLSGFLYTTLPIIYSDLKNYTSYRFECALRSSAILGFIGLPTLGYHLETAFSEGMYSEAAAILYCFYLLILSLKYWVKPRFIIVPLLFAFIFTTWDSSFSLANLSRFLTYDILPWPMREAGYYDGSHTLQFQLLPIMLWLKDILFNQALPGLWLTLLLTQIALVASGIFTLLALPHASKHISGKFMRSSAHLLLIILRTTPEYMLAYIMLQLWGPSMLPAILALALHNGAILAYLGAKDVDEISLPFDTTQKRVSRYLYELLPRMYGQFLAFLFYRWEIIMRESAILGILGLHTLGFYIDSAMSVDHLDTALVLILITAAANMVIDTLSQKVRTGVRLSSSLTISRGGNTCQAILLTKPKETAHN